MSENLDFIELVTCNYLIISSCLLDLYVFLLLNIYSFLLPTFDWVVAFSYWFLVHLFLILILGRLSFRTNILTHLVLCLFKKVSFDEQKYLSIHYYSFNNQITYKSWLFYLFSYPYIINFFLILLHLLTIHTSISLNKSGDNKYQSLYLGVFFFNWYVSI